MNSDKLLTNSLGSPAANTRQRQRTASTLQTFKHQSSGNINNEVFSSEVCKEMENNEHANATRYVKEVLHNTSPVFPVIGANDFTPYEDQSNTVLSIEGLRQGCQVLTANKSIVGQLVDAIEQRSPSNSPFSTPGNTPAKPYKTRISEEQPVVRQLPDQCTTSHMSDIMASQYISTEPNHGTGKWDKSSWNTIVGTELEENSESATDEPAWSHVNRKKKRGERCSVFAGDTDVSEPEEDVDEEVQFNRKVKQNNEAGIELDPEEEKLITEYKSRLQNDDKTVIFEMFEMLLLKMSQVQLKLKTIEDEQTNAAADAKSNAGKIRDSKKEVQKIKSQLQRVTEVTVKTEFNASISNDKIERLEAKILKGGLTITGLKEVKDEKCKETVKAFFTNKLQLGEDDVPIQTAYRIGKKGNDYRTMYVKLIDSNHLGLIFSKVSNLKDERNDNDKPYFINEQHTEKENEERRRINDLQQINRNLPLNFQRSMVKQGKKLRIGAEEYEKKVKPPTSEHVLLATDQEHEMLLKKKGSIIKGGELEEQGSKFIAYAVRATEFEQIQEAYKVIKSDHLGAHHLPCGYRIYGKNFPFLQDYSDDGDFACGRRILEVLKHHKVFNLAIFIVRYYGGTHIGPLRFELIKKLSNDILTRVPGALDYGQNAHDQELLKALNTRMDRKKQDDQENNGEVQRRKPRGLASRGRGSLTGR